MFWQQLLAVIIAAVLIWILYRYIKNNPEAFSKASMMKSFSTMGVLGLILIAFIALCVALLKAT